MSEEVESKLKEIISQLERKISVARKGYQNDYKDGVVDGLIIAIRTIEGY